MNERTVVIGGGLAGLAAATALADCGLAVTLLESRPRLGGRASSFTDAGTGETIDNCQHVAMGCCTNFRKFCRTLKIEELFRVVSELTFIGPDGSTSPWRAGILPAPFHLVGVFLRLGYLTFREQLTAARALRALARQSTFPTDESFADWLRRHKQPPRLIDRFWNVVLVSALSESLDRIDVKYARKVFVDGFLANREGWVVTIPRAPLDEIYGGPILNWLKNHNADVRLQSGVQSLESRDGRITAVRLRSGELIAAEQFVVAVPHDRVSPLLPDALQGDPFFAALNRFETAPISSVHLWLDRPITLLPHAVLVGHTCQWLFQRPDRVAGFGARAASETPERASLKPRANSASTSPRGAYYQIVVSASRAFLEMSTADAIRHVVNELSELFPAARDACVNHARIVTEHHAVFSPLPGIDNLRPPQQSPIPNLQLAGDWTSTGWPSTMEGAVKSGFLAAENILKQLGRPATIVAPGLPVSRLSRWLLGLPSRV